MPHKVANVHNKTDAQKTSITMHNSVRMPASFSLPASKRKRFPAKYVVWNSFSEEQLRCMLPNVRLNRTVLNFSIFPKNQSNTRVFTDW